jgi:hypothetical protein
VDVAVSNPLVTTGAVVVVAVVVVLLLLILPVFDAEGSGSFGSGEVVIEP